MHKDVRMRSIFRIQKNTKENEEFINNVHVDNQQILPDWLSRFHICCPLRDPQSVVAKLQFLQKQSNNNTLCTSNRWP